MSTDFHNANDALKFLEGKGKDTSMGRVFLASDVEEAVRQSRQARLDGAIAPNPKTMAQAKRMVRQDEELMASFDYNRTDLGASIPAGPDSSSRT
jgi:DNA-binding IclR family transcriptional regulator